MGIDKNVPLPIRRKIVEELKKMVPGDSKLLKETEWRSWNTVAHRLGIKVTFAKENGKGRRVWLL